MLTGSETILEAIDLRKRFGSTRAVDGISLKIFASEIFCIIGANGAGKSTLLLLLGGATHPNAGEMTVFGLGRWRDNFEIRKQTTFCTVDGSFGDAPTPREYLKFIGQIYQVPAAAFKQRLNQLAAAMNYEKHLDKVWTELSLGMTRKAALIAAFLPDARLRILDEPFAGGIDPQGMETLFAWFAEARGRGETIVFSTQVLDQAETIADRILILDEGRIRRLGTPAELIAAAGIDPHSPRALARTFLELTTGQCQGDRDS